MNTDVGGNLTGTSSRLHLKKILLVTGIFPPDDGGPATYVSTIAAHLTSLNISVEVITYSNSTVASDKYPFRVHRISRKMPYPFRVVAAFYRILTCAATSDLVFVNGLYTPALLAARILNKPACAKYVGDPAWERANARGYFRGTIDEYQTAPETLTKVARALRAWTAKQSHRVIVPSIYLYNLVRQWGVSPSRITLILNAMPAIVDKQPPPERKARQLVVVSRLVPHKQVDQVVRVLNDIPDAVLTVIGEGPCRANLETLALRTGVNQRVHFLGAITRAEVLEHLSGAALLVLNSTYEGLPHVVLEAIAVGTPVVVRDSGGSSEAVVDNETGILVREDSDEALANAIRRSLEPGAFPNFAEARCKLLKLFSIEEMLEKTVQVLTEVASHGSQRHTSE